MASLAPLRRFAALDWRDRLVLGEALLVLSLMSAAAAILPFRRAIRLGARKAADGSGSDEAAVRRIAWCVARMAAYVPWRALCLHQGLAVQLMLRRRGVDAILCYGVGQGLGGALTAHVWVTVETAIVIGGDVVADYRKVACWPGAVTAGR